ncbi:MAG: hypothetical protein ACTHM8_03295 [Sphingomonas sp.]
MTVLIGSSAALLAVMLPVAGEPRQSFADAPDAALFVDAERWIDDGMLSATCGKHDSAAIATLKRDRRRLRHLEGFADRNHQLASERARTRALDASTPDETVCIPESHPEEQVEMVDRMISELERRSRGAGRH